MSFQARRRVRQDTKPLRGRQKNMANQNNDIVDRMESIAAARQQDFNEVGEANYARIEAQALLGNALGRAVPYAALGTGLGALAIQNGALDGMNTGVVGVDPLAASRNRIAEANSMLGSERVLEALTKDQVEYMDELSAGTDDVAVQQFNQQVSQLVDQRASELRTTPIMKSDGTSGPMPYDQSIRFAQEEVNLQLRAQGII